MCCCCCCGGGGGEGDDDDDDGTLATVGIDGPNRVGCCCWIKGLEGHNSLDMESEFFDCCSLLLLLVVVEEETAFAVL